MDREKKDIVEVRAEKRYQKVFKKLDELANAMSRDELCEMLTAEFGFPVADDIEKGLYTIIEEAKMESSDDLVSFDEDCSLLFSEAA